MQSMNHSTNVTKIVLIIVGAAIQYLDKGADFINDLIEQLAPDKVIADTSRLILASMIINF